MRVLKFNKNKWKKYFFTIWTGQIFSLLGSSLVDFALIWYMTEVTGSAIILTTATLVEILPKIVLSPILGALVDRWNRRLILIFADGLIAVATIFTAFLFWADLIQIWHIYILLFIRTTSGVMHYTALQSATSLMVPEEQLTRVAGLNQTLNGIITIGGGPLGAFCLMIMPIHAVLAIDVVTAAIAILPIILIRLPEPEKTPEEKAVVINVGTIVSDLKEGFKFVKGWPGLVALFWISGIINIFVQPIFSLIPLLVVRYFNGGAIQYGMIGPAFGIGVIVGGLLISTWGGFKNKIHTVFTGGVLMGVSLLASSLVPPSMFWVAMICFFFAGVAITFTDAPMVAIFQANIPNELQGRVLSFSVTVSRIAAPIGLIVAGPLADLFDVRLWFWIGGAAIIIICLIGVFTPVLINMEKNASKYVKPKLENVPAE